MKKFATLLLVLSVLASQPVFSAENAEAPGEAALKKIVERADPSESNINVLLALSGEWEYTATLWAEPGVEPQKAFGKITNKMTLGNRFLASTSMGALNIAGHETVVNGEGRIGFDNAKQAYTSVWTDTLSTGMMIGNGKYDEKAKTITETGRFTNPINGTEENFRAETRLVDADNYERVVYTTGKSGKESKLMEFQFTKKM
ncbi:MAG: DUF1579 family protein [Bryobacteraceae bacterium]|nr:DUF1579 family protein [Bryobacteraceae bacterium]